MANSTISQIKVGNATYDIKPAAAYQGTDTKVKQNNLTSGERPLLLASAATPTTAAGEVYQNSSLKYNTGTGALTAPEITGAYINCHPENAPSLIPFIYNDIAFLENQGGSVSMYKVASSTDMTQLTLPNQTAYKPSNYANIFDGSPSYMNMSGFTAGDTATSFVIDITLPRVFSYSNLVYIDFGSANWRAKNITILVSHTNMTNYVQKIAVTNLEIGNYKNSISHSFTASGATTVTQGFTKIRFVLTNFNVASPRIAQIGLVNYGSSGTRYTTMSRGIDDAVWRSITPNASKSYSLGSSSKLWYHIYGTALHTDGITAVTTANQSATKYWATNGTVQNIPTVPSAIKNPSALTVNVNGVNKVTYDGDTATSVDISTIGTVTATVATAATGTTPSVKVTNAVSTAGDKTSTFAFTLPNAKNGTNGVGIGTVTATVASVASNVAPTVTVSEATSGSNKNVTMAFKLPKGDTGATGATGVVSVTNSGSGNAVTSGSYNSATKTITLTKGATYLTSSSLSGYAKTSDLGNYIPLTGSSKITGSLISSNNSNLGSAALPWTNGYFTNVYTGTLLPKDGSDLAVNSKFFNIIGAEGHGGGAILSIGDGHDRGLIFEGNIQDGYVTHEDCDDSLVFCSDNFLFVGNFGDEIEYQQSQPVTNTNVEIRGSLEISSAINSGSNSITMQDQYMAMKLYGNELCIGNKAASSATTLNINYRSITGCGTFSGFVLRAGSSTSLATLQCGAVTAPAFYQTSDIRKKNIIDDLPLDKCIDLVDKCQTVIYTLKDQTKEQIGMIAQEVEEFFPEVISTDEEGYKSLDYSRLVVVCLKVLKDLMKRVSDLERR